MKYLIALLILVLATVAAVVLYKTGPKTKKAVPVRVVPIVETAEVHPGREKVFVEAFGTVIPSKKIILQSEVEGRITEQNPELVPGGLINQDDMVVQIDPRDYELLVNQYRAELEEARFELEMEMGKQVIAEREWKLMEEEIRTTTEGKSLALREPHLRMIKARVEKAESRLAAAELALKRSTVLSPFNSLVLEEFTDKGQLVNKQTPLATLAGTDRFWVQVSVPVAYLHRISLPSGTGQPGSSVKVIFEPVNSTPVIREGHVSKIMGDLDPEGRMARILIDIDDPLNLHGNIQESAGANGRSPLLLESYVKVMIDAGFLDNVYRIPRESLREGDVVWVKDSEDKLQIRPVNVVWRRVDDVLGNADLKQGDRLILSRLQSPLPGMTIKDADIEEVKKQGSKEAGGR